jgi:hypothetical protein
MCGPDPTLEILVELEQPNPVDSQEDGCDPEKIHSFRRPLISSVFWVGLEIVKNLKLGCEKYFSSWSQTEQRWRCSYAKKLS